VALPPFFFAWTITQARVQQYFCRGGVLAATGV